MTLAATIERTSRPRVDQQNLWAHLNGAVLRRAALVALILGSVLTLVNQWDAIFGSGTLELLPLALVYVTPFVVVAISQLFGARQAASDVERGTAGGPVEEDILATAISHGIPLRAALVGLMMGSANATITVAATLIEGGDLGALPLPLLAQAFSLPILFGVLSQATAYRRAMARLA